MRLDDLLNQTSEWLKGTGANSDIVISSRVRLARNLEKHLFSNWADKAGSEEVLKKVEAAVRQSNLLKTMMIIRLADLDVLDKQFLIERHLMSHEHVQKPNGKALIVDDQEIVAIMVNEEDHLRMQVMQSGFDLIEAWNIMNKIDDELSAKLNFAFSEEWGYLTACPTNTGTGLRGSVMLHLPALVITRQINKVLAAVGKLGFNTRGFYGEGTQATGNFFQISNLVSLGHMEDEIIENMNGLVRQIIDQERQARNVLIGQHKAMLEDKIARSLGVLMSAHIISSQETTDLLSMVRLGVDMGLIKDIDRRTVNELFIITQPAHLQKFEGKNLSAQERDAKRAEIIRNKLKQK